MQMPPGPWQGPVPMQLVPPEYPGGPYRLQPAPQ
jgi:hypothetical protein